MNLSRPCLYWNKVSLYTFFICIYASLEKEISLLKFILEAFSGREGQTKFSIHPKTYCVMFSNFVNSTRKGMKLWHRLIHCNCTQIMTINLDQYFSLLILRETYSWSKILTGIGSTPPKLTPPQWLPIKPGTDFGVLLPTCKFQARPPDLKLLKAAYPPRLIVEPSAPPDCRR